jgi:hypothetical protein
VVPRLVEQQGLQLRAPGLELDGDAAPRDAAGPGLVEHRVGKAHGQDLAALELAPADEVGPGGRAPDLGRVRRCRRAQRQVRVVAVHKDVVLLRVVRVELCQALRLEGQAEELFVVRVGFPLWFSFMISRELSVASSGHSKFP